VRQDELALIRCVFPTQIEVIGPQPFPFAEARPRARAQSQSSATRVRARQGSRWVVEGFEHSARTAGSSQSSSRRAAPHMECDAAARKAGGRSGLSAWVAPLASPLSNGSTWVHHSDRISCVLDQAPLGPAWHDGPDPCAVAAWPGARIWWTSCSSLASGICRCSPGRAFLGVLTGWIPPVRRTPGLEKEHKGL